MSVYEGPAVLVGMGGTEVPVEASLDVYRDGPLRGWLGVLTPENDEDAELRGPIWLRLPDGGQAQVFNVQPTPDGDIEIQGSGEPPWLAP